MKLSRILGFKAQKFMHSPSNQKVIWALLAGGGGERLWPLSTPEHPKALIRLGVSYQEKDRHSLLGNSILRLRTLEGKKTVVVSESLASATRQILIEEALLQDVQLSTEPQARGTLASLAWVVANELKFADSKTVLVFLPSDHWIQREDVYQEALRQLVTVASNKVKDFVFLGMKPTEASTSYGYHHLNENVKSGDDIAVEKGAPEKANHDHSIYEATRFVEKPLLQEAKEWIESKKVLWNMGVVGAQLEVWDSLLNENLGETWARFKQNPTKERFFELPQSTPEVTLYAKLNSYFVVQAEVDRIDLGNFNSIRVLGQELGENLKIGNSDLISIDSVGNFLVEENGLKSQQIALLSVEDLVIVNTPHTLLIAKRDQLDQIKKLKAKAEDKV